MSANPPHPLEQSKRIRRVVSSGGGAKGVVYPGSYKAMVDTGLFKGVETLAGASAGAISATLMALGMPPTLFREQLLATNFKDLMGNSVGSIFKKNAPGISFMTKDGKPLERFIRDNILTTIRLSLQKIENLEELANKHPDFNALVNKIKANNPRITFGDLALLNQLFPVRFKQLVISAVQFPGGAVHIFNSKRTPDVEIALACRASASIPVILEPVEIEINGIKQQFIDGGLYDNLPTDYFDTDSGGAFIKNTQPSQTLVLAFGEGLDNKKNQIFQALYGQRWDEAVTEETLEKILMTAKDLFHTLVDDEGQLSAEDEADLLTHALKLVLQQQVRDQLMTTDESMVIMAALKKSLDRLLLKPKENQEFWTAYRQKDEIERVKLWVSFVKKQMTPILYDAGILEKLKRNVLVKAFGSFNAPYNNTDQKEIGYQKLRSEYPLRTVELRVGSIKTTDFDEATKLARVMDSLGYLDTINHITNHDLHDPDVFNADQFYVDLVDSFEHIHRAVLFGAGKNPNKDGLNQAISSLQAQLRQQGASNEVISRQVYQLIKDRVEERLDGGAAFALSRAVEFHNKLLTAEALFKETYEEGFKRSGLISVSNITGEQIFRGSKLHDVLKDKNMFELYKNQSPHQQQTRTDLVYSALRKLDNFNQDEHAVLEHASIPPIF